MMRQERKKLLAKIAYLYYVEGKSQSQIAAETGIYRTSISRMLTKAKDEGIVKIEIKHFDTQLFQLESYIREKYHLKGTDVVESVSQTSLIQMEERLAQAAAETFLNLLSENMKIGFSWGKTLSLLVEKVGNHRLKGLHFYPLVGGPSHMNARYHVNTLIYNMANKFRGECSFINAIVIQENRQLANGILSSKYFQDIKNSWECLDLAVIGIGGEIDAANPQWLDMLTADDFMRLDNCEMTGEICCRLFDSNGESINSGLQDRTIAISLESLVNIPNRLAIVYGAHKAKAVLAALKAGYMTHLVIDEDTILKVLQLDNDTTFASVK